MVGFPTKIETERLILRPFKVRDASEYFLFTRDDQIKRYVPYACPETLEDTRLEFKKFYSKCDLIHDFYLMLEEKVSHKLIGALIVTQNINKKFDMSLIISADYRRSGYMTEALEAFISFMPKGSQLLFIIDKNNDASYNLVKKLKNAKDVTKEYKYDSIWAFMIIV